MSRYLTNNEEDKIYKKIEPIYDESPCYMRVISNYLIQLDGCFNLDNLKLIISSMEKFKDKE